MNKVHENQSEYLQSQQLHELIASIIQKNNGLISFAEYMSLALYTPLLGYYANASEKFGSKGDFVTAPLISPLFSQCLAQQCQKILENLGQGDILEMGGGTGKMAGDILTALAEANTLPDHYYIHEISTHLRKRQKEYLKEKFKNHPELYSRIHWPESLDLLVFKGIILGNEFFDALPVHRFQIMNNTIYESCVTLKEGRFTFTHIQNQHKAISDLYHSDLFDRSDPHLCYSSEIHLNFREWVKKFSQILTSGVMIFIDYGFPRHEFYHPSRSMGTLMCHYQHQSHGDPFLFPGRQDITAHIDFTHLAEAAIDANVDLLGFTNQASFLIGSGLIELLQNNQRMLHENHHKGYQADIQKIQYAQSQAVNTLTSPAEMGELFKVMVLGKEYEYDLIGLELNDMRNRL